MTRNRSAARADRIVNWCQFIFLEFLASECQAAAFNWCQFIFLEFLASEC